jgi:alanine racemase
MTRETARTWAEIHLDRLAENYRNIRAGLTADTKYMALVKANAYGHGAVPVAKKLAELGADYMAVACLEEGIQLREAGITTPILILGYTHPQFTQELLDYEITQTVYDTGLAEAYSKIAAAQEKRLKIHLKADTGMSRLGFLCDAGYVARSAEEMAKIAALPGLEAEGIFTHFAVADSAGEEEQNYSHQQISRYNNLCRLLEIRGVPIPIHHAAASAAMLNYPQARFNMVRPGIIQYGLHPDPCTQSKLALRPVMEVKSRVASIKSMPQGTTISYGRTYTLERDSLVAVVPMGYGDGLFRLLSNCQEMLIRGQRAKQIGRVCMDMCMLDITDLEGVCIGDEVTVFGEELPLEEKAQAVGTITYEMLCDISPRVPRVYVEE